jgi:hypothetical protein
MFKSPLIDYIGNCLISLFFCKCGEEGRGKQQSDENLLIWKWNFFLCCDVIKRLGCILFLIVSSGSS